MLAIQEKKYEQLRPDHREGAGFLLAHEVNCSRAGDDHTPEQIDNLLASFESTASRSMKTLPPHEFLMACWTL